MIDTPIYWKVITADKRSSAMPCSNSLSVTYIKQVWVKPKLACSKLMVFDSVEAATKFAGNPDKGLIVVQCHIKKSIVSRDSLLDVYSLHDDVVAFWTNGTIPTYQAPNFPLVSCKSPVPDGTVFADEVFCLE